MLQFLLFRKAEKSSSSRLFYNSDMEKQPHSWGRLRLTWQFSRGQHPPSRGWATEGHCWKGWLFTENENLTGREKWKYLKVSSRTWESLTCCGLQLVSVNQEPSHTSVFRKGATSVAFLISRDSWTRDDIKSVLFELRGKRAGLLLSGPLSSFQMKVNLAFHLAINILDSGGRVERPWIRGNWSPVWSFHSLWWFSVPCHFLMLAVVGPLDFIRSEINLAL